MFSGLLWYDTGLKTDFAGVIEKAAARYAEKFGKRPDSVFVNPLSLPEGVIPALTGMTLQTRQTVMQNYIYVGISPAPKPVPSTDESRELERAAALKDILGQLTDRRSVADALTYGKACEEAAQ